MLWTLLTATSSGMFIVAAVASVRNGKIEAATYALAITIGVLLALGNVWFLSRLAHGVAQRTMRYSEARQEWCFRGLYFTATVGILFAAFFGDWVTSTMMRLIASGA